MGIMGSLMDALAAGAATGVRGKHQLDLEDEDRKRLEEEKRAREAALRDRQDNEQWQRKIAMLREFRLNRRDPETPVEPDLPFRVNVDGVMGNYATPEEAIAARNRFRVPDPVEPASPAVPSPAATPGGTDGVDPVAARLRSKMWDLGLSDPNSGVKPGGDPDKPYDRPDLGEDFDEVMIRNEIRRDILNKNPGMPREAVEAEVDRIILAAGS